MNTPRQPLRLLRGFYIINRRTEWAQGRMGRFASFFDAAKCVVKGWKHQ